MSQNHNLAILCFLSLLCLTTSTIPTTSRKLTALVKEQPLVLQYHKGPLLKGNISINLIWYGHFTSPQRAIILDFIHSLSALSTPKPSTSSWWKTTEKYHHQKVQMSSSFLVVGHQSTYSNYPFGKMLKNSHLVSLANAKVPKKGINVVLTAKDVSVEGFCMNKCGTHGATKGKVPYVWVGNSELQCPGYCAWPFHQPIYGPQTPPLVAPNGDVGIDGMIINLATVLAGTVTNPFNDGYFQGPATAPLEAVSACTGVFGSGAYPGYPGQVLVDKVTGASFNAHGVNGRKFLLPAMWDPQSSTCKTLM